MSAERLILLSSSAKALVNWQLSETATRNHLSLLFGFEVTSGGRGGGDALSHSTSLHARINDRCKQANAVTAYFGFQLSLCGYRSSNKNSSESAEEIPFLFSKRHVQPLIFSPHVSHLTF